MKLSRNKVQALDSEIAVYALNTGVGLLANVRLEKASIEQMQLNSSCVRIAAAWETHFQKTLCGR